jgi:YVTN family beta-propeller protein
MRLSRIFVAALMYLGAAVADPVTSKVYFFPGPLPTGGFIVVDAKTAAVINSFGPTPPYGAGGVAVSLSADGTRMYFVNGGRITIIDVATGALADSVPLAGVVPAAIAVTPNGNGAWVTDYNTSSIFAVDLVSKQVMGSAAAGIRPVAVAITNDGSQVYVADELGSAIYVIDQATRMVLTSIPVGSFPLGLRFSPDGTELWVGVTGAVQVIDPISKTVTATVPIPFPLNSGSVTGIAFHPSQRWVYLAQGGAAGNGAGPIVVDRAARQIQKILGTGEQSWDIAVTADGSRGFTANSDGTATVLDTNGNSVNGSINGTTAVFGGRVMTWQPLIPAIVPTVCVTHNNDGTYTANYGYGNSSVGALMVPIGPSNFFSPGAADRGQPTTFLSGAYKSSFSVVFDGAPLTWTVQAPFAVPAAITVSGASKNCY